MCACFLFSGGISEKRVNSAGPKVHAGPWPERLMAHSTATRPDSRTCPVGLHCATTPSWSPQPGGAVGSSSRSPPFPRGPFPLTPGAAGLLRLRWPLPPGPCRTSSPLAPLPLSRRQAPASLLPPLTPLQPFSLSADPPARPSPSAPNALPALFPQRQPLLPPFSLSAERPSCPSPSATRVGPLSAYMGL